MGKNARNPGWTNGGENKIQESYVTAFEAKAAQLGLQPWEWAESTTLREWALKHRNHRYIPEDLLNAWGIDVNAFAGRKAWEPKSTRGLDA